MNIERALAPKRILFSTTWFSLLVALTFLGIWGERFALSFVLGAGTMSLSFLLLSVILSFLPKGKRRSIGLVAFAVFGKILLFFGLLYYLFASGKFDHLGLALGISTLWVVIFLKALALATIVKGEMRHK